MLWNHTPTAQLRGVDAPEVELKLALAERRALERLVRSLDLCQLDAGLERGVVDGLKDFRVQPPRLGFRI